MPPVAFILNWIESGLLIHRAAGNERQSQKGLANAMEALAAGVGLAVFIDAAVIATMFGGHLAQMEGLPFFALIFFANAVCCFVFLELALFVTAMPLRPRATATHVFGVFGGAIPILQVASVPFFVGALRLFLERRDPSLPYFSAAVASALVPENPVSDLVLARAWLAFLIMTATALWYGWQLVRLVFESVGRDMGRVRMTIAVMIAVLAQLAFERLILGRASWLVLGATFSQRRRMMQVLRQFLSLLLAVLLSSPYGVGQASGPTAVLKRVELWSGKPTRMRLFFTISSDSVVERATLYYRDSGVASYRADDLSRTRTLDYVGTIPLIRTLDYYIQLRMEDGSVATIGTAGAPRTDETREFIRPATHLNGKKIAIVGVIAGVVLCLFFGCVGKLKKAPARAPSTN